MRFNLRAMHAFLPAALIACACAAVLLAGCKSSSNPGAGRVLTTVMVTPAITTVSQNATAQFTVVALDQSGVAFGAMDITVTWAVDNGAAGSIDAAGLFTAGTTNGIYNDLVSATITHIGTTEILADTSTVTVN